MTGPKLSQREQRESRMNRILKAAARKHALGKRTKPAQRESVIYEGDIPHFVNERRLSLSDFEAHIAYLNKTHERRISKATDRVLRFRTLIEDPSTDKPTRKTALKQLVSAERRVKLSKQAFAESIDSYTKWFARSVALKVPPLPY